MTLFRTCNTEINNEGRNVCGIVRGFYGNLKNIFSVYWATREMKYMLSI